ncbi:MAG: hypothetical protein HZA20_05890 [Nitrospirae bacterium]|nr:hypothetical protein [Nitrospirota bacterium]
MAVKVTLTPAGEDSWKASCDMFGLEATAETKEEASSRINAKIKEHVDKLAAEGKIVVPERAMPVTKAPGKTVPVLSSCGCSGKNCKK